MSGWRPGRVPRTAAQMRISMWAFLGGLGLMLTLSAVAAAKGYGNAALVILLWAAGIVVGMALFVVAGWWIAWPARLRPPFRRIVEAMTGRADPPH